MVYQPTCTGNGCDDLSDPAIDVEGDALVCGETTTLYATISNTNIAQVTAEDVVAQIDVPIGFDIIPSTLSVNVDANSTMNCEVVSADSIECTGELAIGEEAVVTFDIEKIYCSCDTAIWLELNGQVSASNGDLNVTNNFDTWADQVIGDGTQCPEICVDPITSLEITSHVDGQTVSGGVVTLS